MSHTNSTPNYNLPQFVGTDKPTWLNDVNGAFSSIDTQMKANADSATTANTTASTAQNAIGTLSGLNTTAKTDLVNALNEVNTNLGTTSGVASSASATATQANNKATALESTFNINNFENFDINNITKSNCNIAYGNIHTASNADGTLGKIYGFLGSVTSTSSTTDGYISFMTPFRPTQDIVINDSVLMIQHSYQGAANSESIARTGMTIKTTGEVRIAVQAYYYNRNYNYYLPPCLYFMKDFGDVQTPQA